MMLTVCELFDKQGSNTSAKEIFPCFFDGENPRYLANVKGAPNFIISDCDSWTTPEGNIVPLTDFSKAKIMQKHFKFL